jgi:glycosyltransferase involved in cell wall biosynthesis
VPTDPRASVLIGVYNGARTLRRAIDSGLAQTLTDVELIVVDDGSSDATAEIADEAGRSDERVRVVRMGRNTGIARTLNAGLRAARTPYVAILDADDEAAPRRIQCQLAFLQAHPEVAVVGSRSDERDVDGRDLVPRNRFRAGDVTRLLWSYNPIPNATAMVRRDAVLAAGGYDARFRWAMEYDLWVRLARRHLLHALDEVLTVRYVGDGVSARFERRQVAESAIALARGMVRQREPRALAGIAHASASWATPLPAKRALRRRRGMTP